MFINGAQAILESLKRENVDVVFGYPGGSVLTLYDELYKMKFPHILTRHEQGAVHAADGYARSTGKVGVCFATSGPGGTNLITGIATANMDSVPLVCFTGQVGNPSIGKDSFQEADICGITTPITKHNYLVKKATDLPRVIKEAFFIARTGRPGPVVIDVAKDVLDTKIEYNYPDHVELKGYSGVYDGRMDEIEAVVTELAKAERPLIFVGGGAIVAEVADDIRAIIKRLGVPSTTTLMGIGCISADTEGFLSMAGMHGAYAANMAIQNCDLLLSIGMRFSDRVIGKASAFAPKAKIIHFEIDKAEVNKSIPADMKVMGDLRWTIPRLRDLLEADRTDFTNRFAGWLKHCCDMSQEKPLSYKAVDGVIKPQQLVRRVSQLSDEDTIVVTDVGQHQMWAAQFYEARKPRHFLTSGGLGTMGFGLPAALGAKLANPDKNVVLFTGDGSIMMNCQEFATAADYDIDVKVIIVHNCILGMVAQWQRLFYSHHYSQSLLKGKTDFVKLAEAMGVKGYRMTDPKDLETRLPEILAAKGPALIDVWVPEDEDVLPMVPGGHSIDQMVLGGSK